MSTLYELFNVKEDANTQQIEEAYNKIIEKANSLPQNDKIIEQVRRVKIAYGILIDPEKRKKYDLARKRAEELLGNIQVKNNIVKEDEIKENVYEENEVEEELNEQNYNKNEISEVDEKRIKKAIEEQINHVIQSQNNEQIQDNEEKLKQEKIAYKQQKKLERKNKRLAKKEAQYQREKQIQAYGEYLQKQGYRVKYPWTWPRVKRLLISIFVVIIFLVITWQIPFVQNALKNLYQENFVIKVLVDIIVSIFEFIVSMIKGIFIRE